MHAAAGAARRLHQAHAALRADGDVQFLLPPMAPPTPPPAWLVALGRWLRDLLRPVGRGLRWLGSWMPDAPYARALLWSVIAIAVAAMAWAAWNRIREGAWRLPRWRRKAVASDVALEEEWSPDAAPVHAWLQEADALAADGHYAEAAHRLLFRSVEDIARRRPRLVRPALTSRELGAAGAIPAAARTLFADIAALVERSLFGGRGVDREEWLAARDAYTRMTLAEAWRA
ncbi:DUF4129 domain-containing protein [Sphingomonas gellani]|uniref:DUF4129 domain-containing protein n=1 Tax=Sphingomonas gellani TaxID=1166340 RepID=UPI001FCD864C|nr:DUF4129 domain-containing protein [Sphingomonas gellani]